MRHNRRHFLARTGLAGLGLTGGNLFQQQSVAQECHINGDTAVSSTPPKDVCIQRFNMSGFAAPPLDQVRVGIIGLGQRGPAHMQIMSLLEGVDIKALCDIRPAKAAAAKAQLTGTRHNPDLYTGDEDWKRVCDRHDLDLVILATPCYMHAAMAAYAMNHGKHVAVEVPAAVTLEECWLLVETAERTRRHCMMMENYCYMSFQLMTLNMARQGFFGQVFHADCAYNTSKMQKNFARDMYWDMWWLKQYASRKGNIYPTHGLGPVSTIMNINRGDKFEFLVSVESNDFMMKARAQELAATDNFMHPFAAKTYRGTMNVTTIRTARGCTITVQHDASSPSPHNLIHGIYGTQGAALLDPPPPRLCIGNQAWASPEEFRTLEEEYTPAITRRMGETARRIGARHGGSDLLLDWRLIDCLRNGLPLDLDVYDAAAWSAIVPLSQQSVLNRSNSIDVPDFTAQTWKTNGPNMDINLQRGGNTKVFY